MNKPKNSVNPFLFFIFVFLFLFLFFDNRESTLTVGHSFNYWWNKPWVIWAGSSTLHHLNIVEAWTGIAGWLLESTIAQTHPKGQKIQWNFDQSI